MTKKISEMNEDELRDYALQLENDKAEMSNQIEEITNKQNELQELNTQLQKRNHALFLKVEQQVLGLPNEEGAPTPSQTCEDLGMKLGQGEIK